MAERLALGDYDQWHHFKADVQMIRPVVRRGRPRRKHVPDVPSIAAEGMLITAKWQNISWRTGTKGKLKARFAAVRVRVADGPAQWIRDKSGGGRVGVTTWLAYKLRRPAHRQPSSN
jgi:hypothetical protein